MVFPSQRYLYGQETAFNGSGLQVKRDALKMKTEKHGMGKNKEEMENLRD